MIHVFFLLTPFASFYTYGMRKLLEEDSRFRSEVLEIYLRVDCCFQREDN
jgi:hypothetical protein